MSDTKFQVGLIQMSCGPEPDDNLQKAGTRVREAARSGAQVICLPELFRTQYFCQREDPSLFDLAETVPGHVQPNAGHLMRPSRRIMASSYGALLFMT